MKLDETSKIKLKLLSTLKNIIKMREIEIRLNETNETLGKLLSNFCEEWDAQIKELIFGRDSNTLNPNILILINDVEIHLLNALDTILLDNDVVTIIPSIHGG